jgi:chaperonin GroES
MPLRPLYDRVLVRPHDGRKTASGIVVAGQPNQPRGQVVATGDGHVLENGHLRPLTVQVGDIVEFDPNGGYEIEVDGEQLVVFQEAAIIGIIS